MIGIALCGVAWWLYVVKVVACSIYKSKFAETISTSEIYILPVCIRGLPPISSEDDLCLPSKCNHIQEPLLIGQPLPSQLAVFNHTDGRLNLEGGKGA